MNSHLMERYERQIRLPGFGKHAQQLLMDAHVLIVGAGGLGCPVLQYLVAAGVGHIGIADDDVVSVTNLQRQVIYNEQDVGKSKVVVAVQKLSAQNSTVHLTAHQSHVSPFNCLEILELYDYIVDCSDNFATRYLLNDACELMGKPLVYGAVNRFEGQVSVFHAMMASGMRSAGYRDIFPVPPKFGEIQDCSVAGVLGVLPGMIGTLQAVEVIKLITGIGTPLNNQLLTYSILDHRMHIAHFEIDEENRQNKPVALSDLKEFDYGSFCEMPFLGRRIDAGVFDQMIGKPGVCIIDCREEDEMPRITEFDHVQIPFSKIDVQSSVYSEGEIVFFCQSGKRSKALADKISSFYEDGQRFFTLENGITSWIEYRGTLKTEYNEG